MSLTINEIHISSDVGNVNKQHDGHMNFDTNVCLYETLTVAYVYRSDLLRKVTLNIEKEAIKK